LAIQPLTPEEQFGRWRETFNGLGLRPIFVRNPYVIVLAQDTGDSRDLADTMYRLGTKLLEYSKNLYQEVGGIEAEMARVRETRAFLHEEAEPAPVPAGAVPVIPPSQRRRRLERNDGKPAPEGEPRFSDRVVEPLDPANLGAPRLPRNTRPAMEDFA
jgi:hypothetical protein